MHHHDRSEPRTRRTTQRQTSRPRVIHGRSVEVNAVEGTLGSKDDQSSTYFAGASLAITWIASMWRISPTAAWSGDYSAIRDLSGAALGDEAALSTALATLFRCLPMGTLVQRVALVSAFGAGWVAWFGYQLILHTLAGSAPPTRSSRWLAMGSTMLITMSVPTQRLATVPGGSTVAVAICLGCVLQAIRYFDGGSPQATGDAAGARVRQAFTFGAWFGLVWIESQCLGWLTTSFVGIHWVIRRKLLAGTTLRHWILGWMTVFLGIQLPWLAARRGFDAARVEHPFLSNLPLHPFSSVRSWLAEFYSSLGVIWSVAAVVGLLLTLRRSGRRHAIWTVGVPGMLVCWFGHESGPEGTRTAALACVGVVALISVATKALQDVVRWAIPRRTSAANLAITLVVVFQAVTALARNEEAAFATDHYRGLGSEAWTDEALVALPARAVILVKDRAIVERLLAAQVIDGARADVLVVPLGRSTDDHVVSPLIAREPSLTPVLRDLAINGKPTENSLSSLADVRPVFVEFDGTWDRRLREHLLVLPFLHRVFSQTLGRSDRTQAIASGQRAFARILKTTSDGSNANLRPGCQDVGSALTRRVLDRRLREQLTLLLALGDRASFDSLAQDYDAAFVGSKWMLEVRQRLRTSQRTSIDTFDLLERPDLATATSPVVSGESPAS